MSAERPHVDQFLLVAIVLVIIIAKEVSIGLW